eukprot:9058864-Prorocentrum_lima.AAC.1
MTSSLVGSEMCIRDRVCCLHWQPRALSWDRKPVASTATVMATKTPLPVSYTHLTLPTICSV